MMGTVMARSPRRLVVGLLSALAVSGLVALGWLWQRDRGRTWEEPRWDRSRFVCLSQPHALAARGPTLWVVAVNLDCPHCRVSLHRAAAARLRHPSNAGLVALVVDSPRRPRETALADLDADELWWDERGTWRRRWGHRIYGEILVFAPSGRWLRTIPPGSREIEHGPRKPRAPGTSYEGSRS